MFVFFNIKSISFLITQEPIKIVQFHLNYMKLNTNLINHLFLYFVTIKDSVLREKRQHFSTSK